MNKLCVNSLPKSGTHLLIKLLESMGYEYGGVNFSTSTLYGRYEWPKFILRGAIGGQASVDVGLDISAVARRTWVRKKLGAVGEMEFCTGHMPYSDNMRSLAQESGLKSIHIIRDPRDVLVSWAHYVPKTDWHYGRQGLLALDLESCVKTILNGYQSEGFGIESFSQILQRSIGWVESSNVLVIKFEDLVGAQGGGDTKTQVATIKKIASFIGVNINNVDLIASSLFGGTKVFRKGKIGGWRDELSLSLTDEVNSLLDKWVIRMGYEK